MLPRRCILCCDTSITRSWHGQCVSSSALKAAKSWRVGSLNGSLRNGRISSSIGKTAWSACLPDGSRVRRESHARFCERLGVRLPGPTHPPICGTNYKTGRFTVRRKTIAKRMAAKLKDIRAQLRKRMHERIPGTVEWLQQVVKGYFQYHAVPGNFERMRAFRSDVLKSWIQTLRRRSQLHRMSWERFAARLASLLPPVQILHPYPDVRFAAKHPSILGKNRVR